MSDKRELREMCENCYEASMASGNCEMGLDGSCVVVRSYNLRKEQEDMAGEILGHYGPGLQERKAIEEIEEMGELIVELAKSDRNRIEKTIEEIADVTIMLMQLKKIYGEEKVALVVNQKLERTLSRIDGYKSFPSKMMRSSKLPPEWKKHFKSTLPPEWNKQFKATLEGIGIDPGARIPIFASKALEIKAKHMCPKCKSEYGVVCSENMNDEDRAVICINGNCDFSMNVVEWNEKYPQFKFD